MKTPDIFTSDSGLNTLDFFKYRLNLEIQRANRNKSSFSIAVIHFDVPRMNNIIYPKEIIIPYLTKAIASTIRSIDAASIDERNDFLVFLAEADQDAAVNVVRRIFDNFNVGEIENLQTSVCAGISTFPKDSKTIDELIQSSKFAMFQASHKGNNAIFSISSIRKGISWKSEVQETINSTNKKFEFVIESTVKSLLSTFETKDPYLKTHSFEVANVASHFAEYLGLKEKYVKEISLAALLHDVGFLQIPNSILFKKGKLTQEEMDIIKQHPVIAANNILSPIKSFENIIPIILDHHERWDGKGYPNSKSKRDIHIAARILSIVDTYNAMLHERPYRKALSSDNILNDIRKGANSIWEDKMVDSFISFITQDEK